MKTVQELFDLTGHLAIVTGGAGLLGSQMASALAEAGADVVVASRDLARCEEKAATLRDKGLKATALSVEVSDPLSIKAMMENVLERYERIDVLVNSAVQFVMNSVEEMTPEEWDLAMNVNVRSVFLYCQAVAPAMKAQGGGSIINLGSIYGLVAPDRRIYGTSGLNSPLVYSAAKAAVIMMSRYLGVYWAEDHIRVNTITPGGFLRNQDPDFMSNYNAKTPMGRMGNDTDLKAAVVYLASDASAYVTGHNLIVDGGWTAW